MVRMIKQQGKVLIAVFFLFFTGNNVFAQTNNTTDPIKVEYLYPANKEKVFTETVDQFYEALRKRSYPVHQEFYRKHKEFYKRHKNRYGSMDTALFKDMPDSSVNFRKKVLFNKVERFYYITWDGNGIPTNYPDIENKYNQAVSPNRQVYFFYSFKDTEKDFYGRCAVYDVETKKLLTGGEVYINKYAKPRK